jgi:hypothetical protein
MKSNRLAFDAGSAGPTITRPKSIGTLSSTPGGGQYW